jgi:hypothetical protein
MARLSFRVEGRRIAIRNGLEPIERCVVPDRVTPLLKGWSELVNILHKLTSGVIFVTRFDYPFIASVSSSDPKFNGSCQMIASASASSPHRPSPSIPLPTLMICHADR